MSTEEHSETAIIDKTIDDLLLLISRQFSGLLKGHFYIQQQQQQQQPQQQQQQQDRQYALEELKRRQRNELRERQVDQFAGQICAAKELLREQLEEDFYQAALSAQSAGDSNNRIKVAESLVEVILKKLSPIFQYLRNYADGLECNLERFQQGRLYQSYFCDADHAKLGFIDLRPEAKIDSEVKSVIEGMSSSVSELVHHAIAQKKQ